jgi:hypothetical protein
MPSACYAFNKLFLSILIMMKTTLYILSLSLIAFLTSCEKILEFDGAITKPKITVNAVATPDTVFIAGISRELFFTDVIPEESWESFYPDFILENAEATITVNGRDTYPMQYNPENLNYESTYIPAEGDEILINVSAPDLDPVESMVVVPVKGVLEILKKEVIYSENYMAFDDWMDIAALDTVMRITAKITDPPGETNYYRLKVRSIGYRTDATGDDGYVMTDVFSSADVIFRDERLVKRYWGWPAGFSNVFDDHLFNEKEYTFTVETRMRWGADQHVVVELQSITRELYNYLKSVMLYRITDQDSYTESIQIYSNINGGYGILGALNGEKHILYFNP